MPSDCIAFNESNEMEYTNKNANFLNFYNLLAFLWKNATVFFYKCSLCGRTNTVRAPCRAKVVNSLLDEVNFIFSKCILIIFFHLSLSLFLLLWRAVISVYHLRSENQTARDFSVAFFFVYHISVLAFNAFAGIRYLLSAAANDFTSVIVQNNFCALKYRMKENIS